MNLVGLGIGPTLVALATDRLFDDDLAVGKSLALVSTLCAPLALVVLGLFFLSFLSRLEVYLE